MFKRTTYISVYTLCCVFFLSNLVFAQNKGMTYQVIVKNPSGAAINAMGITVNVKILAKNGCVLREEEHSGININNGYLNLSVMRGTRTGADPNLSAAKVFDNSAVITGLTCINLDGTINGVLTSYSPIQEDTRKLRVRFMDGGNPVIADFNIRSSAFAFNAEKLDGKDATDFVGINALQGVTQSNIESVFNRFTKLDNILNNFNAAGTSLGANITGNAATATTATTAGTATNFTGSLSGDITGTQGATSIAPNAVSSGKIADGAVTSSKLNQMGASSGQVLKWNGSAWVASADNSGAGALVSSDITTALGYTPLNPLANSVTNTMINSVAWSKITSTPTTLSGYGISDAVSTGTSLSGDVSGMYNTTSVTKIRGVLVDAAASTPTSGDVLRYDGSKYVATALPSAPVSSVFGRTGAVTLTASDVNTALTYTAANSADVSSGLATKQPLNANLTTIAGLSPSANQVLKWSGSAWVASTDLTGMSSITSTDVTTALGYTPLNPLANSVTNTMINSVAWSKISSTPTTLSGYGISDAVSTSTSLSGDVSGLYNTTSVTKIRGVLVDAAASTPTSGDVLRYDGSKYVATALPSAPVSSVFGRTGAVTLTASDVNTALTYTAANSADVSSGLATKQPLNANLTTIAGLSPSANQVLKWSGSAWVASTDLTGMSSITSTDVTTALGYTPLNPLANSVTNTMINSVSWSKITSTPTTLSGYGISDAVSTGTSLSGDVTGLYNTTSVTKIRGVLVDAAASTPTSGDVLRYDGSKYVATALPSAPVSSVFGRTGAVTLTASDVNTALTYTAANSADVSSGLATKQPLNTNLTTIAGLSPSANQVLKWSGSAWVASTDLTGMSSITSTDVTTALGYTPLNPLANSVTNTMINSVAWSKITSTPTTLSGYGISDAVSTGTSLSGDVTGLYNTTSVTKIRGVLVDAAASTPTSGDVLRYDGSKYVATALPSAPVSSVFGRTGAVTLTASDVNTALTYTAANSADVSSGLATKQPLNTNLTTIAGLSPSANQVLKWSGSAWVASTDLTGMSSITSTDVTTALGYTPLNPLANSVTNTMINSVAWSKITSTPTTLSGYGISDAVSTGTSLSGDVTGLYNTTSVTKIRGVLVDAAASTPTSGDVLRYDGSKYVATALPSAPVSSVFGRTGAVTLTASDVNAALTYTAANSADVSSSLSAGLATKQPLNANLTTIAGLSPSANQVLKWSGSAWVASTDLTGMSSITSTDVTTALGYTPLKPANNLSDVSSTNTALNNLLPAQSASKVLQTDGTNTSWLSFSTSSSNNTLVQRDGSGVLSGYGYNISGATSGAVTLQSPSTVTSYSLRFPAAQGGANQVLSNNGAGDFSWITPLTSASLTSSDVSTAGAFVRNGNSFGATAVLGTNDNNSLQLKTNNTTAMTILADGKVGIGTTPAAKLDVNGTAAVNSSVEGVSSYVSSTAAYTIPDSSVNIRRITLTANTTLTLPSFSTSGKAYSITVFLKQDATGSRTVTWAGPGGDTVKWDSGTAPTISSTANKITIIQFLKPGDETVWYGSMVWKEN